MAQHGDHLVPLDRGGPFMRHSKSPHPSEAHRYQHQANKDQCARDGHHEQ
jgi:hypothetical protein